LARNISWTIKNPSGRHFRTVLNAAGTAFS
jgi:hypothetical protein